MQVEARSAWQVLSVSPKRLYDPVLATLLVSSDALDFIDRLNFRRLYSSPSPSDWIGGHRTPRTNANAVQDRFYHLSLHCGRFVQTQELGLWRRKSGHMARALSDFLHTGV